MKIEFLGAYGGNTDTCKLTSFLVDECLALDSGALSQTLSLERQKQIRNILISHAHLDHTLSLPFLADNLFGTRDFPLKIWALPEVIEAMKKHLFNETVWPDFSRLPSPEAPTISFCPLEEEKPTEIDGYVATPIRVNHTVPCSGFLLESPDRNASLLYTADTGNTSRIWEIANQCKNLAAVIVDCSFPNEMEELARVSGHMTPTMLAKDLACLEQNCPVLIYHIKPGCNHPMIEQLEALGDERIVTDIQGLTLEL